MKINFKTILAIIVLSTLLALSYNYFSSEGIPLIAEEKKIMWADDSLFISVKDDIDSTDNLIIKPEKNVTELNPDSQLNKNEVPDKNVLTYEEKMDNKNSEKNEPEMTEPTAIHLKQAYTLYKQNILFIDAREPEDYNQAHIKNAINLPMDHFEDYQYMLEKIDKNQKIVTYCAGSDCDLSIVLGNVLFDRGYKQLYVFFGGWNEWTEAGYPIEKQNSNE